MNIDFKLPELKEEKGEKVEIAMDSESEFPSRWDRQICLPVSKKQIDKAKVGDTVTFKVTGKVTKTENMERNPGQNRTTVDLDLTSVSLDVKGEMEKLLDDDE